VVGSIIDCDVVDRAMSGIDTVIHLPAVAGASEFVDALVPPDMIGVYNLSESTRGDREARDCASSGQATNAFRHRICTARPRVRTG
jgi:hypothetical protein